MSTTYTPDQVTMALMALIANGGDTRATADELINDEFQVPKATLERWKNDLHQGRYIELERKHGEELERVTVERLRASALRATEIEAELLEELRPENVAKDLMPQALRAVADVKSKSVDKMLALTGRPSDGKTNQDPGQLLRSLAAKGLVKVNVNIEAEQPAIDVEHEELLGDAGDSSEAATVDK